MRRPLSLLTLLLGLTLAGGAAAQQNRAAIVDEAVRAAEQAQAADKERVKQMSEQAAAAANAAPTGTEAVGSAAPPAVTTTRLTQPDPARKLSLRDLLDRPVRDRGGEPVGQVRDVVVDANGAGALVLVETGDGQAKAVNAARLLAAPDKADGYRVDLDRAGIAALPTFRRDGEGWRMAE
jgi:sporulation protein YlmC with PRC-barrel domain